MLEKLICIQARALNLSERLPFHLKQRVVSHLLSQALAVPLSEGELAFLEGKILVVEISDANVRYKFTLVEQKIMLTNAQQEDVRITGDLKSFLNLMAKTIDPDSLFFQRKVTMTGDTELGLTVKNLLDAIDFEDLPGWFRKPIALYQNLHTLEEKKSLATQ